MDRLVALDSGEPLAGNRTVSQPYLTGRMGVHDVSNRARKRHPAGRNAASSALDFDASRKYPVLMYTYGGPGSQVVLDTDGAGGPDWNSIWFATGLSFSRYGGRARFAGGRGRDFKKVHVSPHLGQIRGRRPDGRGAKWLGCAALCGSASASASGAGVMAAIMASLCIIAGRGRVQNRPSRSRPVTHWQLYDSIYTERYMRRPDDNPEGYEQTSPLTLCRDNSKAGSC